MKPTILCVDDEPMILESLSMTLRREYAVLTATSGAEGLIELAAHPEVGVILSDMRMPVMNGAEFLQKAKGISPNSVRMLLTGETDLSSAIRAVNEGGIFRFLTKPCPPAELLPSIQVAFHQHNLLTAEKQLLEQTLLGSISTMTEILGLISPSLFGRSNRIKKTATDIGTKMEIDNLWQLEVAAALSQLGLITLPQETVEKVCRGRDFTPQERHQIDLLPTVAVDLIKHIPRLEGVCEILLKSQNGSVAPAEDQPHESYVCGQILRVANKYEQLTSGGVEPGDAVSRILLMKQDFSIEVLAALENTCSNTNQLGDECVIPAVSLKVNMTILEDIILPNGSLFAPRGYTVTESLVNRIQNFGSGSFDKPVRVRIQSLTKCDQAA